MFDATCRIRTATAAALLLIVAGCTVHPAGEKAERQAATVAGRPYAAALDQRAAPALPAQPTIDDLVRYALLTNADVERAYWEWRAALEQIPIDGTEATNLTLNGSLGVTHGRTSLSQATIGAGNDPMADIVLPNKLDASARRALELARAAGKRFHQAQLELRAKVVAAYDDYALTAELSRLGQQNADLLATIATVTEARNRAGAAGQQDVLRTQNERDLARSDLAANDAQLPAQRADLNALLNRPPDAPLPPPADLPPARPFAASDADLLATIARQNPQLAELTDEVRSRQVGIEVARLLYEPDISIAANTDLQGVAQTVSGMITVPILKYEAIRASVAQARANPASGGIRPASAEAGRGRPGRGRRRHAPRRRPAARLVRTRPAAAGARDRRRQPVGVRDRQRLTARRTRCGTIARRDPTHGGDPALRAG